ncbi:MAG: hypothetical protein OHK0029_12530 [Armatimonadaceae bacterium]
MEVIFERYAAFAIAVKTQHAYERTLRWEKRDDATVSRLLEKVIAGQELDGEEKLCLGDWCLARGAELAAKHGLPIKIHTGHYAGNGWMPMERIRPSLLAGLLSEYPQTRFVLMHIGYPYGDELVSLAKHYPNAWVDMCWAWSIDPFAARDFLRRMLHAVPSNKLCVFGGDAFYPIVAVGYALQTRQWLLRTLEVEIHEGFLTEKQAIHLALRWMRQNQEACFDLSGTRAALRSASPRTP